MTALLIGYARCSTDQQDLTAQRDGLAALGVAANRVYVDHGLTGTNRERPGLREALAACREGDTLVVTKLDRLARSLPDARACGGKNMAAEFPTLHPEPGKCRSLLAAPGEGSGTTCRGACEAHLLC